MDPSGEIATHPDRCLAVRRRARSRPVSTFHSLTVPSSPPDTKVDPSLEKAGLLTKSTSARKVLFRAPVAASQSSMVPPRPAEAIVVPPGAMATPPTPCCVIFRRSRPVARSQIRIVSSSPPDTSVFPSWDRSIAKMFPVWPVNSFSLVNLGPSEQPTIAAVAHPIANKTNVCMKVFTAIFQFPRLRSCFSASAAQFRNRPSGHESPCECDRCSPAVRIQ